MDIIEQHKLFDGVQYRCKHYSALCQCDMHFSLYMPPQATQDEVPLLTWLSGLTCTDENFVLKAGAQRFAAQYGLAILVPDTSPRGKDIADEAGAYDIGKGAGFYLDATLSPWAANYQMYSYITEELPELLKTTHFKLNLSRQGIFGHSMGGHGALTIGLKNRDRFQSISAFAPICSPMHCSWGIKAFKAYLGNDQALWQQYDACYLIETLGSSCELLVDQGTEDEFLQKQLQPDRLLKSCRHAKALLNLRYQDGYDHSYFFIASFIEDHIKHHSQTLKSEALSHKKGM